MLKHYFSGFIIKFITGIDDSMIHIPVISNITKTRKGKIAFGIGIFLAITLAIIVSLSLSTIIRSFNYYHLISAIIIFLLAVTIQFDLFTSRPKHIVEDKIRHLDHISMKRFFKLIGIGFITAFITVIDDSLAYMSLFISDIKTIPFSIAGIYTATIIQIFIMIYFSRKISKILYKKEITVIGLVILSALTFFKVL